MATTNNIQNLSPELLYCIFDRCDTHTIYHSILYTCKLFYEAVNHYRPTELKLVGRSPYNFKLIFEFISRDSITSLTISNNAEQENRMMKFLSHAGFQKFNQLHYVKLQELDASQMEAWLDNVIPKSLKSLAIDFAYSDRDAITSALSSVLSRLNLEQLSVNHLDSAVKRLSWPTYCNLKCLQLMECEYSDFPIFLDQLPNLKTFDIQSLMKNYNSRTVIAQSTIKRLSSLKTLIIKENQLEFEYLTSLLVLTPNIHHLKLKNKKTVLSTITTGSQWENILSNHLVHLEVFEFFFTYKFRKYEKMPSLTELIDTFRTPYWLDVKRWFITCRYYIGGENIQLYTSNMNIPVQSYSFILSSEDRSFNCTKHFYHDDVKYLAKTKGTHFSFGI